MQKQEAFIAFRFYGELNDFLLAPQQQTKFHYSFKGTPSIKDLIESVGIPHTEIRLILVNGEPVDFNYPVQHKDLISVYPAFNQLDISTLSKIQLTPLKAIRFVLDTHLGKLAKYLRMLGLDALYQNDFDDEQLAFISANQQRILLTRDRDLLKRKVIEHGRFVRDTESLAQVKDILLYFGLENKIQPFSRCIACNGLLQTVDKNTIQQQLQGRTSQHYELFKQCQYCGNIYWQGSHYENMNKVVASIVNKT